MSEASSAPASGADTIELRCALQFALCRHFGESVQIETFVRRQVVTASSFPLEALDVTLSNGRRLQLVFKDVSPRSLSPIASQVKPTFLFHPLREIDTYRLLLNPTWQGTATYYGSDTDVGMDRYWLFLERVAGQELYQIGDLTIWQQAARWLAQMHHHFAGSAGQVDSSRHLLEYDHDYYQEWPHRARQHLGQGSAPMGAIRAIDRICDHYATVVRQLSALPKTLLHGEFYPSNILIQETDSGVRICPVDWEMAAIGPGIMDVAALIAGTWSDDQRVMLARTYYEALPTSVTSTLPFGTFLDTLDYGRLHLAVQWLGWAPDWSPPAEHRHDWLAEAIHLAEKLRL